MTTWWQTLTGARRAALREALNAERGQQYLEAADGAEGFAAWLLAADHTCIRRLGVSIFDLSDWGWRDAYDAGATPAAAVRDAVADDDTFGMLLGGDR